MRKLKGLEDVIPYTSVHWEMLEKGNASGCHMKFPWADCHDQAGALQNLTRKLPERT